jgi:hypothetical protein
MMLFLKTNRTAQTAERNAGSDSIARAVLPISMAGVTASYRAEYPVGTQSIQNPERGDQAMWRTILLIVVLGTHPAAASAEERDPETVVFATLRPSGWNIYLFDGPEKAPKPLTEGPDLDYKPAFSPDGRYVVSRRTAAGSCSRRSEAA